MTYGICFWQSPYSTPVAHARNEEEEGDDLVSFPEIEICYVSA